MCNQHKLQYSLLIRLKYGDNRVRNFRGRVSYFNQSEARKHPFLASDWLKYETLPRKFRTLSTMNKRWIESLIDRVK